MNIFKLAGRCNLPIGRTDDLVYSYLDARKKHFRILLMQYGSVVLFKTTITAALLFLGSILVIQNQITIGQFVAAEIVVLLIMSSVEKLILGMDNIYDVLTALEKIGFVTDLPLENHKGLKFSDVNGDEGMSVRLDQVTFQHADADRPTLDRVSLQIKKGERICIAGYNGSGKATLIKMLEGSYSNYDGMVTYNDIPLKSLNVESLRHYIGSLKAQDEIFNGTIIENISLGDNDIPLQAITKIAQEIGLHSYINRLPNGYQTELLASGINIPGSIRAKVILARALLSQPQLLVLENFMPRIERVERNHIIELLTDRARPWTLVGVSNNPDFAAKCDRVVIMKRWRHPHRRQFPRIIWQYPFAGDIQTQLKPGIIRKLQSYWQLLN